MYNVALNIKTVSTQIRLFLKLHIFFITKTPPLNTKQVNLLIQSVALIHVKKIGGFKKYLDSCGLELQIGT